MFLVVVSEQINFAMKPRLICVPFLVLVISSLCQVSSASKASTRFIDACQHGDSAAHTALSRICRKPSPPIPGFISCTENYDHTSINCVGTCMAGYTFPGGSTKMVLDCSTENGEWYPYAQFKNCTEEGSKEQKLYIENEKYKNHQEDSNEEYAETLRRCKRPDSPAYGGYHCTYDEKHMKCVGKCNPGYLFPGRRQEIELQCKTESGVWVPHGRLPDCSRADERYTETDDLQQLSHNTDERLSVTLQRCQRPSPPVSGRYDCKYDDTHMKCVGKCNSGYIFPGRRREMEIVCQTDRGAWYPYTKFPDCIREGEPERYQPGSTDEGLQVTLQRCRKPEPPANGRFDCKYDNTHMRCVGKCNPGYLFPGRRNELETECQTERGAWYPYTVFPDCTREVVPGAHQPGSTDEGFTVTLQRCQKPEPPANGRFDCKYDNTHMRCVGKCNPGYLFHGGHRELETECQTARGSWYPYTKFPDCTRDGEPGGHQPGSTDRGLLETLQRCQRLTAPVEGLYDCKYDDQHMRCIGKCNPGYLFPGRRQELVMECRTEEGFWRPYTTFPNCSRGGEPYGENGRDHRQPETKDERLQETLRICLRPNPPVNGHYDCTYDDKHMKCVAKCKTGYYFPGRVQEMEVQCRTQNGVWYPVTRFPDCSIGTTDRVDTDFHRCRNPTSPTNGHYNCNYENNKMICTGMCNPGYIFPGGLREMKLQCHTSNGYWYPSRYLDCVRDISGGRQPEPGELVKPDEGNFRETLQRCQTPTAPANGNFSCKYNATQMTCSGACKPGYSFPGRGQEMQLQCQTHSGYWYPYREFPDCTRDVNQPGHQQRPEDDSVYIDTLTRCGKPESPFPGHLSCHYDTDRVKCVGNCAEGYYFSGGRREMILECSTRQGVWYPIEKFPQCYPTGVHTCNTCNEHEAGSNRNLAVTLRTCRRPDPPMPGNVNCQYDSVGMNCTGICKQGYYFPDRITVKIVECRTDRGTWYPHDRYPECIRSGNQGFGDNTGGSGIHTCQDCNEHEAGSSMDLTVTLRNCRRPDPPIPGNVNCQYNSVGMNCTGTCKQGYYFPDRTKIKVVQCRTNSGTWYPFNRYPECVIRSGHQGFEGGDNHGDSVASMALVLAKCQRPSSPSPGRVSCSYDDQGMSCIGTCSLGYYFPNGSPEMVLNCSVTEGLWRPIQKFPQCELRDDSNCESCNHQREGHNDLSVTLSRCRRPSSPIPGRVTCQYDYLGMNCTGTCKDGYSFPDGTRQKITQCYTTTGTWHPMQSYPECIEYGGIRNEDYPHNRNGGLAETLARCKPPNTPVPGMISCSYNTTAMSCIGVCSRGYTFPGRSTRMTLECITRHGTWYPFDKFPKCEEPARSTYDRGQDSHQQPSSRDLLATLNRCKSPSSPVPGNVTCQYDNRGMNCTGTCKQGHHFRNGERELIVRCLTNTGTWYPFDTYPECIQSIHSQTELERIALERQREERLLQVTLNMCRRPNPPELGSLKCSHDTAGMNCTGYCRSGYYFPDGTSIKYLNCITERGTWYPELSFPECRHKYDYNEGPGQQVLTPDEEEQRIAKTLIKCRKPAAPTNGKVYCRHNSVGMICTGQCDSGYHYQDGTTEKVLRCTTASGTWSSPQTFPPCFESRIRPQPRPEISTPTPARIENDALEETLRNCIRPVSPRGGHIICKHNPVEMNCTAYCNHRYHFHDRSQEMTLQCFGNTGVWRPSYYFPDCIRIKSDSPDEVENLEFDKAEEERLIQLTLSRCRRPSSSSLENISCNYDKRGMNCTGMCNAGHSFPDGERQITLTCRTERGTWYPLPIFPTCTATVSRNRCRKPLSPRNGDISCNNDTRRMTCFGRCTVGYFFPNNRRIMDTRCSFADGVWEPVEEFPSCSRRDTDEDDSQQVIDRNENINSEDACKELPGPPHRGFLSCIRQAHTIQCTGTCLPDYKFSRGESSMALVCSLNTGKWTPRASFPPCFMERSVRPTPSNRFEQTTPEQSGNNEDHQDTDSQLIEELDRMCPRPPTPKGGYIDCTTNGGLRKCTGTCMRGYVFPNGRSNFILRCSVVGTWTPRRDFPRCVSKEGSRLIDEDERRGGDTDVVDRNNNTNTHNRPVGYCRRPATPKSGYIYCIYNSNIMECTAKCGPGYSFPRGETSLIHTCEQKTNRWTPANVFPDCQPICDSACYNGGICVRPNQCFCPQEYRGNYCQHALSNCDPRQLRFAGSIRCNHTMDETVCELGCPQGTKLDYPSYGTARCSLEGTWTPRFAPRCIEDPSSTHSNVECGGSSQCSSSITEGLCQKPATPSPGTLRCIYNQLMMECTGKCANGYKFTDGKRENIRTCDKRTGRWTPARDFPECKPICERGCQNGGECFAPNICICPMRFRGDECQYSFSNCDPHRLRFAGSIRCNHTTTETVCRLGCPEGTVLDQPAYDTVRCTIEGIWSPSVLPRCVEDLTYETRLLATNRQSGMRYEGQYRQSEVSRTESEYENRERYNEHLRKEKNTQRLHEGSQMYDKEDNLQRHYEPSKSNMDATEKTLSRLEQEDRDMYQHKVGTNNRGILTNDRDESNANEGMFRHYQDFLQGKDMSQDYDIRRRSSVQSKETEGHQHKFYQKSVNRQEMETYREHTMQLQKNQYNRHSQQHGHGGHTLCPLCSP